MPSISELKAASERTKKKGPSLEQIQAAVEATKKRGRRDASFRTAYFAAPPGSPVSDVTAVPPPVPVSGDIARNIVPRPGPSVAELVAGQGTRAPQIGPPGRMGLKPLKADRFQSSTQIFRRGVGKVAGGAAAFMGTALEKVTPEVSPEMGQRILEFFDPTGRREYAPPEELMKLISPNLEEMQAEHPLATTAGEFVGEGVKIAGLYGIGAQIRAFAGLPTVIQDLLAGLAYGQVEAPGAEGVKLGAEFVPFGVGIRAGLKALPAAGKVAAAYAESPRLGEPFPDAVRAAKARQVSFVGRKAGKPASKGNPAQPGDYVFHDPATGKRVTVTDLADLPEAVMAKRALYERGKMGEQGKVEPIEPGRELGKSEEAAFPELRTAKVAPPEGQEPTQAMKRAAEMEEINTALKKAGVKRDAPDKRLTDEEGQAIADELGVHYGGKEDFYDQFIAAGIKPKESTRNAYTFRREEHGGNFSAASLEEARVVDELRAEAFRKGAAERAAREKANMTPITERPLTPEELQRSQEAVAKTTEFEKQLEVPGPEPTAKPPAEPGVEEAIDASIRAEKIRAQRRKVDNLEKKLKKMGPMVPPPIRAEVAAFLAKQRAILETMEITKPPVVVETPTEAVKEIIEGKRESKIGMSEFKTQMTAKLDEAIANAPKAADLKPRVPTLSELRWRIEEEARKKAAKKKGRGKRGPKGDVAPQGQPPASRPVVPESIQQYVREAGGDATNIPVVTDPAEITRLGREYGIPNALPVPTADNPLNDLFGSRSWRVYVDDAANGRPVALVPPGHNGLSAPSSTPPGPAAQTAPAPGGRFDTAMQPRVSPIPPGVSKKVARILNQPTVSAEDIVNYVKNALNKPPVRIGKQFRERPRVRGLFFPFQQSIWMKSIDNFPTLAHEFAHSIDNQVLGTSRGIASGKIVGGAAKGKRVAKSFGPKDRQIRKELMDLDYDPKARRVDEGFAEYMRYRFTSDIEAPRLAPQFHEWFNTEILAKNSDLAQVVHDTRALIRRYQDQGAAKRINSWIDRTKGPFDEMRSLDVRDWVTGKITRMRSLWEDTEYPIERIERLIMGGKLADPEISPSMIARALKSSDQATAKYYVEYGAVNFLGTKVGPGLREILSPFNREEVIKPEGLMDCMVSKVVVDRAKHGQSFTGFRVEDAQWVVDNILADRPDYQLALKQITEWGEHLMRYLQDAGGLSEEAILRIKKNNEFWIPLMRVFAESETRGLVGGGGRGYSGIGVPIKRGKGGEGRQIVDPLETLVDYARQIISVSNKVRVGRALVQLAKRKEGVGKWIQEVQQQKTPVQFQAEQIKRDLLEIAQRRGIEIEVPDPEILKETWDDVLTVYMNSPRYTGKDNVISIMEDGKQKFYEVDKEVYRAFEALDSFTMPPALDWIFGKPARSVRLGATGLNLGFQGTNLIRDAQTFAVQSQYFDKGLSLVPFGGLDPIGRAFMEELRGSASFERFKAAGLEMSGQVGSDRRTFKRTVDNLLSDTRARKAWNVAKHPIDITREMLAIFENAPRFAEWEMAEAKYGAGTPRARIAGAVAEREVTTNFQRAGYYGRWANQMIPFFNPAIQGISKWGRTLIENPRMTMLKVGTNITLPSLAVWYMNKDEDWYKRLQPWDKWGFFHFKVGTESDGGPRVMRLPRPFEWGYVFGADVVAVFDQMYNEDPDAVMQALGETVKQFTPPLMPTALGVPLELKTNFDLWRDKPISQYFLTRYNYPEDQYYGSETQFAIELGKLLGVPPRKIDFAIRGYTGGLGIDALKLAERSGDYVGILPDDPTAEAPDWPIIGRFFSRIEDEIGTLRDKRLEELLKRTRDRNKIRKSLTPRGGTSPNAPGPVLPPKVVSPPKINRPPKPAGR